MKDWSKIAEGLGSDIPADQIARIAPTLDVLAAAFAPLVAGIGAELDSSVQFDAEVE